MGGRKVETGAFVLAGKLGIERGGGAYGRLEDSADVDASGVADTNSGVLLVALLRMATISSMVDVYKSAPKSNGVVSWVLDVRCHCLDDRDLQANLAVEGDWLVL